MTDDTKLTPRVLVARSIGTSLVDKNQALDLLLLSREGTEEFHRRFPSVTEDNLNAVLDYADKHALAYIGEHRSSSGFPHQRLHKVDGTDYHLGHVFTEEEAFGFGYVEPHIDTVAGRIVQVHASYPRKEDEEPHVGFTAALRAEGLITGDQSAMYKDGQIDVFSNDRASQFSRWGPRASVLVNESHPVRLHVFSPEEEGLTPVCAEFFVPKMGIYEFLTYAPVEGKK